MFKAFVVEMEALKLFHLPLCAFLSRTLGRPISLLALHAFSGKCARRYHTSTRHHAEHLAWIAGALTAFVVAGTISVSDRSVGAGGTWPVAERLEKELTRPSRQCMHVRVWPCLCGKHGPARRRTGADGQQRRGAPPNVAASGTHAGHRREHRGRCLHRHPVPFRRGVPPGRLPRRSLATLHAKCRLRCCMPRGGCASIWQSRRARRPRAAVCACARVCARARVCACV
jgi:hypothetical protein